MKPAQTTGQPAQTTGQPAQTTTTSIQTTTTSGEYQFEYIKKIQFKENKINF